MKIKDTFLEIQEENAHLKEEVTSLREENTRFKAKNLALIKRCQKLQEKLDNVSLWDLSEEAQEEAGRQLARELLGGV